MSNRLRHAWLVCVCLAVVLPAHAAERQAEVKGTAGALQVEFETEFRLFISAPLYGPGTGGPYSFRGRKYSPETLAFERRVKEMGPAVIPLLIDKVKELKTLPEVAGRGEVVAYCVHCLSRHWLVDLEWPDGKIGNRREGIDLLLAWWEAGQRGATERFETLYADWNRLKVRNSRLSVHHRIYEEASQSVGMARMEVTEMGRVYETITGLGLGALPPMMDRLRAGDYGVLPFIAEITREEAARLNPDLTKSLEERARECLEWWDKNKEQWTVPFPDLVAPPAKQEEPPGKDGAAVAEAQARPRPPAGPPGQTPGRKGA